MHRQVQVLWRSVLGLLILAAAFAYPVSPAASQGSPPIGGALAAVSSLSGQVRTTDDKPLANVRLVNGDAVAVTDNKGQFILQNAIGGASILVIDGRKAGPNGKRDYGYYEAQITLAAGQANTLPFTSYLPLIDHANEVTIPSPTVAPVVISTPKVPGLELHIPAGMVITDSDGKTVTKIGLTPIPINRTPFPLPPQVFVPVYFTAQPGSSHIYAADGSEGYAQVYYPNYPSALPEARGTLWKYDPDELGWGPYGLAAVNAAATQYVPSADSRIYELTGAMINPGLTPPKAGPKAGGAAPPGRPPRKKPPGKPPARPGNPPKAGEPVDLGTGLFVQAETDLQINDVLPIEVQRTYRQDDTNTYSFGIGTTLSYNIYLYSLNQYQVATLVMPDGGRVEYVRTSPGTSYSDAVFTANTEPSEFYKSQIVWNGNGWDLTTQDGLVYVFGENAPLQAIRDRFGNKITLTRSSGQTGNITRVISPNGKWIALAYDAGNRITQAKDVSGRTTSYAYDGAGRLMTVTDANGGMTVYTWDTAKNVVVSIKDQRGNTFVTNQYDANNRVQTQTLADNGVVAFAYTLDVNGKVIGTDVTDPRNVLRKVTFNSGGYWLTDTLAFGTADQQNLVATRDAATNYPLSMTDGLGRSTEWDYQRDGSGNIVNGNVTKLTQLAGTASPIVTNYTYSSSYNQLLTRTDPLGQTTTFNRNALGQLTSVVDPLSHATSFEYNTQGQLTKVTDAVGRITQFTYDRGDLKTIVDPLSRTTNFYTDVLGRPVRITDPLGNRTTIAYNAEDAVRQVTDANGATTTTNYDPLGQVASVVDPRGGTTTFTYDTKNRLQVRTDPLLATDQYLTYDLNDNLLTTIDRKGQQVTYTYDSLNRPSTVNRAGFSGGVGMCVMRP